MAQAYQLEEAGALETSEVDASFGCEYDCWFSAKVEEGLEDLRQGNILSHDEVKRLAARRRSELLARAGR